MDALVVRLVELGGYWGIFFLMIAENVFPPIPSELIMGLGGVFVARGTMDFWPLLAVGKAGTLAGNYVWYALGDHLASRRTHPYAALARPSVHCSRFRHLERPADHRGPFPGRPAGQCRTDHRLADNCLGRGAGLLVCLGGDALDVERLAPLPGVGVAVDIEQHRRIDLGIDLGGRQARVAEQFLQGAQVRASAKQVRCEAVA